MNFLKKQQSILLAVTLVMLLASWFVPDAQSAAFLQVDFWILWFVAMTLLALPILYLEVALAKRSKKSPMLGMEELTRQADAPVYWRSASWLSAVLLSIISVGLVDMAATILPTQLAEMFSGLIVQSAAQPVYWLVGLTACAMLLSFVGEWLVLFAVSCAVVAVLISGINIAADWRVTGMSLIEWKNAVTLALISTGLGLGMYWQNNLTKVAQKRESSWTVLPIWIAQIAAGVIFALFQGIHGEYAQLLYAVAAVAAAGVLIAYLRRNLSNKANGMFVGIGLLAFSLMLWSLPNSTQLLMAVVSVVGLVVISLYSVFAGWKMKISHLRKAIAFDNEMTYNIWRVAVRLVVPISALFAMMGLVASFTAS